MSIQLITLKTTQTIMCDIELTKVEASTAALIKNPVQIVSQPSREGSVMNFVPFLEYSEEFKTGIVLDINDILCITTPVKELLNEYNKLFGSGIQIASTIPNI
jgi:hypothetical protein